MRVFWAILVIGLLTACQPTEQNPTETKPMDTAATEAKDGADWEERIQVLENEMTELVGRLGKPTAEPNNKSDLLMHLLRNGSGMKVQEAYILGYDEQTKEWIVDPVETKAGTASPMEIVNEVEEEIRFAHTDAVGMFFAGESSENYSPAYASVEEAMADEDAWKGRLVDLYILDGKLIAIAKRSQV